MDNKDVIKSQINEVTFTDLPLNNQDFISKVELRLPLNKELIQDCFMLNSMDAPVMLKEMILLQVEKGLENYLIETAPDGVDKENLRKRLSEVKVTIKEKQ